MKTEKEAVIIVDLGFGDAGKGSLTDFLVRGLKAHTVIRYNGGAQAAHNVITPEGKHHTFAQFGSGTFIQGVRTHLSRFMLVDPLGMVNEELHLQSLGVVDAFSRTTIEREAVITTPFHQAVNRLKETARDQNRHGSCGKGIGETMSDYLEYGDKVLLASDLSDPNSARRKLKFLSDLQKSKVEEILGQLPAIDFVKNDLQILGDQDMVEFYAKRYADFSTRVDMVDQDFTRQLLKQPGRVIFEGAQGVLLDELYGFFPYTTWTNTTTKNAERILSEHDYQGERVKLGAIRAYATRHGVGPFVTEDSVLTDKLPDMHNVQNNWQGGLRAGFFDLMMTRYALNATGGVDYLAVSHLDRMRDIPEWKWAMTYQYDGKEPLPDDYFETENKILKSIKIPALVNLDHQARLTQLLKEVTPNYQLLARYGDIQSLLYSLQQKLAIPIALLSFGPSSKEKRFNDETGFLKGGTYDRAA